MCSSQRRTPASWLISGNNWSTSCPTQTTVRPASTSPRLVRTTPGSTAGNDVAFAHALLRCGKPEELTANPENRLRLTLGLRRRGGRWIVEHEHHSFPDVS